MSHLAPSSYLVVKKASKPLRCMENTSQLSPTSSTFFMFTTSLGLFWHQLVLDPNADREICFSTRYPRQEKRVRDPVYPLPSSSLRHRFAASGESYLTFLPT